MKAHLLAIALIVQSMAAGAQDRGPPLSALRSGSTFAGADVRAMQADDFANPGMLWVERGETLWRQSALPDSASCASCHQDAKTSMRGVATHYPAYDKALGKVIDLEQRIDDCRTRRQHLPTLVRGSDDLLALTAYVAHQSHELPMAVSIDGAAQASFRRGEAQYHRRQGQMNLSCAQCHEQNWGKRLLAETISQGHGNAFPAYRLEWQALGSLQRRIRACLFGIRADMPPEGADALTELELYLAWRAQGLPVEAPGVRR